MNAMLATESLVNDQPLAELEEATFRDCFNRRPFKIEHHLADHPLFDLARLVELAQCLPESRVEYNPGNLPVSHDPGQTPRNGLTIEETIARIEECNSWMVLKNVELDAEYGALLDACLDAMRPYTERVAPGMCRREGFIFISSPGSVTPFHIDPENNFLLQIRGQKEVYLFDRNDRVVISEQDVESFFAGAHRNVPFDDAFRNRGEHFDLLPGQGLHFPVAAPHWVKNGPAVSISFSITFQTDDSLRRQSLYRFNRQMRRLGIEPQPVGKSPLSDSTKYSIIRTLRGARRLVGRGDAVGQPARY